MFGLSHIMVNGEDMINERENMARGYTASNEVTRRVSHSARIDPVSSHVDSDLYILIECSVIIYLMLQLHTSYQSNSH